MEGHYNKFVKYLVTVLLFMTSQMSTRLSEAAHHAHSVVPSCSSQEDVCQFSFTLTHRLTMQLQYDTKSSELVEFRPDGSATATANCGTPRNITQEELSQVVTVDGSRGMVMVVNGQLPGSPIVVFQGQEIVVNITNGLINEAFTMHWHGIHQRQTPWMDGTGGVSQCPINPGETFTYRFIADPVGTHWYHAHEGTQRSEGLYGPLIVLPKSRQHLQTLRGNDTLPEFDDDFYFMMQDYFRESSTETFYKWRYDTHFKDDTNEQNCFQQNRNVDGFKNGFIQFVSAIVNGKGRYYTNGVAENPGVPLETFTIKKGGKYRFRMISASLTYTFQVSIDRHLLHVISSDGVDVQTKTVDTVIIEPGERYDIWTEANDPLNVGNYWIRVESIAKYTTDSKPLPQQDHTLAVLRYEGADNVEPTSTPADCKPQLPCSILNCPYRYCPKEENKICIPVTDLKTPIMKPTLTSEDGPVTEYFLHFHYGGHHSNKSASTLAEPSINGRQNILPTTPPQIYPRDYSYDDLRAGCDDSDCNEDWCKCTNIIKLEYGHVIQLTMFVYAHNKGLPSSHPIHIHGHKLQIVKIGWPEYNTTTGSFLKQNEDIKCLVPSCNQATWADSSWKDGNIPGITLAGAPEKDTVSLPIGGYVVARFKADNPGFWIMHCHMEYHNAKGMSLVFQEGDTRLMNSLPQGFKTCGTFQWGEEEFRDKLNRPQSAESEEPPTSRKEVYALRIVVILLSAVTGLLFFLAFFLIYNIKHPQPKKEEFEPLLRRNSAHDDH